MKTFSQFFDKLAISWAFICALHCAVFPIALALFPSLVAVTLSDQTFHDLMLWLVIPSSAVAVSLGCWQHKDKQVIILAGIGIGALIAITVLGHAVLGELGEKIATLATACILTMAHWRNFKLCSNAKCDHNHC